MHFLIQSPNDTLILFFFVYETELFTPYKSVKQYKVENYLIQYSYLITIISCDIIRYILKTLRKLLKFIFFFLYLELYF